MTGQVSRKTITAGAPHPCPGVADVSRVTARPPAPPLRPLPAAPRRPRRGPAHPRQRVVGTYVRLGPASPDRRRGRPGCCRARRCKAAWTSR